MRICIVTPSQSFATSAGVRIRYDRLQAAIRGAEISIAPIETLDSKKKLVHDAYVFAKTYTAHSYLLGHRLRQMGKLVGVDIFDDYFSQVRDSRLTYHRAWLATMNELVDFVLCSTKPLEAALRGLMPGKPISVIPDPSDTLEPRSVAELLRRKLTEAQGSHTLRVLWFGIGDNPYFPVGIHDLVAFGGELTGLSRMGWSAELTILTNTRALSVDGLNQIRRLPLPVTIEEWSPEREQSELMQSHVSFLPVNGQQFSRMKSLNRAATALVAGCQVLSCGYPLYEDLSEFIYRAASQLLTDFENGSPKVRERTLPALTKRLNELASPERGAETLVSFLRKIRAAGSAGRPRTIGPRTDGELAKSAIRSFLTGFAPDLGIVHGARTDRQVQDLVKAIGGLSVRGPFCPAEWNFHARFDLSTRGSMQILIADHVTELVAPDLRQCLVPFGQLADQAFHLLPDDVTRHEFKFAGLALLRETSFIKDATAAPRLTADVLAACRRLFPGVTFYVSERSPQLARKPELAA